MTQYDNLDMSIEEVIHTLPKHVIKEQFRRKIIDKRSEKEHVCKWFGSIKNLLFTNYM